MVFWPWWTVSLAKPRFLLRWAGPAARLQVVELRLEEKPKTEGVEAF
jgi:hypothetical protein